MTLVHAHRAFAGYDGTPGIINVTAAEAKTLVNTGLASYVDDDPQPALAVDGATVVPGDSATVAELKAYLDVEGVGYPDDAKKAHLQAAVRDHLSALAQG